MANPKVQIVILNWNGWVDTIECIESLGKIDYTNYEILVIDNASSGDDVKILRERLGETIRIIENDENYGFPKACNMGVTDALESDSEYILLLNFSE